MGELTAAERAAAIAERERAKRAGEVRHWDEGATPQERARAYLDFNSTHRVWVVAPNVGVARKWSRAAKLDRVTLVQRSTNLHGLGANAFVLVLPGANLHPDWRYIAKQLNDLQRLDATVIVIDEVDDLEYVGGVDFEPGSRIRPRTPRADQTGDSFVIYHDDRPIAHLDRVATEQFRRIISAYLDGEPMPDPAREAAEAIRKEIAETGDAYGRGGDDE